MRHVLARAHTTIWMHSPECGICRSRLFLCHCVGTLGRGDTFTILSTHDEEEMRYYIVLASSGVRMFYFLASEERFFFTKLSCDAATV